MGLIISLGKTTLLFIPERVKENIKRYTDLILDKLVKRIGRTFMKKENWTFQQDGRPDILLK